ncbi:DNA (cytosine-5)-methyltransferase 1B-like [Olea europaea subsp. europaea]|uniref:DNA (Cytosine-5)-methyltransferase 1B-like n=1 Tax=Olea europaea subsp. europaea TaxID=158383 RepID=A0A8S0TQJ0_OLEEU|nr:DNA (cytosine-5)-methyltransferase 1B-like [Olea europaea subsp. europaea]
MSKKSSVIETKRNLCVEEEIEDLHLTAGGEDDYDCIKPSSGCKTFYDHVFVKASACVEVYKKLTSSGGNPSLTLDELLAAVAHALTGQKCFSSVASIKNFILSQGEFIFKQLICLDETSKKSDEKFIELHVLAALRNERYKHEDLTHAKYRSSTGTLKIGPELSDTENKMMLSGSSNCPEEHDEDQKLARLLNEEEYWHSMKQKKNKASISSSTKFYVKINEDEIVDDYLLPAYYKTSNQETDEYVIFDSGIDKCHIDDLPRSMLHNWALYNADLRMISLELLPMKPCADTDITIFGSGVMTADDGSGYYFDTDNNHSSSSGPGSSEVDGIPIYLSAIKEWMIEFGSSMVFILIRTDMAWYRLGKPSKQYAP